MAGKNKPGCKCCGCQCFGNNRPNPLHLTDWLGNVIPLANHDGSPPPGFTLPVGSQGLWYGTQYYNVASAFPTAFQGPSYGRQFGECNGVLQSPSPGFSVPIRYLLVCFPAQNGVFGLVLYVMANICASVPNDFRSSSHFFYQGDLGPNSVTRPGYPNDQAGYVVYQQPTCSPLYAQFQYIESVTSDDYDPLNQMMVGKIVTLTL